MHQRTGAAPVARAATVAVSQILVVFTALKAPTLKTPDDLPQDKTDKDSQEAAIYIFTLGQ